MVKNIYIISVMVLLLSGCVNSDVKQDNLNSNISSSEEQGQVTESDQNNIAAEPTIDPKAVKLLKQMSTFLASSKQFSFDALTLKEQVLPSGQKLQYDTKIHIDVIRPNAFIGTVKSGPKNKALYFDGSHLTLLDLKNNFYATSEAPNNIDDTLDFIMERYGVSIPLADFLFADVNTVLTENTLTGFYVALTEVNGIKAHHLAFSQDNVDWQIWINADGKPSPVKFVINYKNKISEPQFIAFFQHWSFTPNLKSKDFVFEPTEEMVEIDFIAADER